MYRQAGRQTDRQIRVLCGCSQYSWRDGCSACSRYPGCFQGFDLAITESHQAAKRDTSGTAKAMVASLNALGAPFEVSQVRWAPAPFGSVASVSACHLPAQRARGSLPADHETHSGLCKVAVRASKWTSRSLGVYKAH